MFAGPRLNDQDHAPAGMDSELYIDGALHVDGVSVDRQQKRQIQKHQNPCEQLLRVLRKLWATQQTENIDREKNKDRYVRTTLRELGVYIAFIVVLSIITFGMITTNMYYLTTMMNNLFIGPTLVDSTTNLTGPSFETLNKMEDFWPYMEDIGIPGLFSETWYNNNPVRDYGYLLYDNKLLGVAQLRQKKVRNNSCSVAADFKQEIKFCYSTYAPGLEDKYSFGPCENIPTGNCSNSSFEYSSKNQLFSLNTEGLVSVYDDGGFIQTLDDTQEKSLEILSYLKANLWLTRGTRAVFLDFTIYNANINLFCQIRLIFEFPAVGGMLTSSVFRAVKLIRYVTVFDYFIMACEILFVLFVLYYTIEEIIEISNLKMAYFKSIWSCLDIIIILMSYVCIIFNIYRQFQVNNLLDNLLLKQDQFNDFNFLCYWQWQYNNIVGVCVFLAWIKIFKYISFNKTMTQLSETLSKCARDISGFAVMFFIIFFAYAQLGYLTFGTQVNGFRAFQYSVYTLFLTIMGIFDFHSLQQAHRVLGPLFFLSYVFFVFFVLLNMFLAIINDTYAEVKEELRNAKNEFEISDYVKQGYAKMRDRLKLKHDRISDIRKALSMADLNRDKRLEFDEWRTELKSRGYAEEEIENMFAKYDSNGDRVLDEHEQRALANDLLRQNDEILREMEELNQTTKKNVPVNNVNEEENERIPSAPRLQAHDVSFDEYNALAQRLDTMEKAVGTVLTRVDAVATKMHVLEKDHVNEQNQLKSNLNSFDDESDSPRAASGKDLQFNPGQSHA
ncbi:unnamed protein product [Didymodactylos carnosus]|uniref:EF-hand domain-containing protein n=1 Tax=Didymodactylos carnosus TaxID=1234261 RepID=A0A813REL2_9BILA|nr:unnamed protein product [Didymodactylos carnosus]CAF0821307.1 unnamed protein product [Didymodactylos carnosus]CAF3566161.1 unnamed protein product [Didymodactylos carnosus]CAF3605608.1 unnamed protein product [Didymodactylos carnosus]